MKKLLSILLVAICFLSIVTGSADFSKTISVNAVADSVYADKLAGSTADVLLPHGIQPIFVSEDFKYSLVVEIKKEYSVIPGSVYVLGEQSIYEVKDFPELTNLAFVSETYTWSDWEIAKNPDDFFRLKLELSFNPGTDLEQQIALLEQRDDVRQVNYYSEDKATSQYPNDSQIETASKNILYVYLKKEFSDPENIRNLDFFPEISELVNVESLRYYPDWKIEPGEIIFDRESYRELLKLIFSEDYDARNAMTVIENREDVYKIEHNAIRLQKVQNSDTKSEHEEAPSASVEFNPNKLIVMLLAGYSDPYIKKDLNYFSDIPNVVKLKRQNIISFSKGSYRETFTFTFSEGTNLQEIVELFEAREDVKLVTYEIYAPDPIPDSVISTKLTSTLKKVYPTSAKVYIELTEGDAKGAISYVLLKGAYSDVDFSTMSFDDMKNHSNFVKYEYSNYTKNFNFNITNLERNTVYTVVPFTVKKRNYYFSMGDSVTFATGYVSLTTELKTVTADTAKFKISRTGEANGALGYVFFKGDVADKFNTLEEYQNSENFLANQTSNWTGSVTVTVKNIESGETYTVIPYTQKGNVYSFGLGENITFTAK